VPAATKRTPDLAYLAALDDPYSMVRGAARNVIHKLETAKPTDLDGALTLAANENEPSKRRLRALQRLLRQDPADEQVRSIAQLMAHHKDPVLRAGITSMAGALPDSEAEALFAAALDDADPQVRAAAVLPLIARRAAEGEEARAALIRRLLDDPAPEVQRNVLLSIRSSKLNTYAVRAALRDMQTGDPRLSQERTAWVGASFALGWAFFVGAFIGGGHNSQPSLGAQLTVVGVLFLLVGAHALLGYGLRRMVRA
jgi:hypothetical protein